MVHKLQDPCEDRWPRMVGQTYSGPGRNPEPLSHKQDISIFPPPTTFFLAFSEDELDSPRFLGYLPQYFLHSHLPSAPRTGIYDWLVQGILRNVQVNVYATPWTWDLLLERSPNHDFSFGISWIKGSPQISLRLFLRKIGIFAYLAR